MAGVCPGHKSTILIYDACHLRYFIASFFGVVDTSMVVSLVNSQNAMLQEQFTAQLGALMGKVTEELGL